MSDQTRQHLNQAFEYIKAGNKAQARALLQPILDIDQNNHNAWWLMAMAVETPAEMQSALQNVVRIKPDHANARDMLDKVNAQLGMAPPAPTSAPSQDPFALPPNLVVESPRESLAAHPPEPSLDDLFGEPASTPRASGVPDPDDFFAPLTSSGGRPAYTPPPQPTGQQKKSNPLLYILIGLVVATACICGGCLLLGGGSFLAVVNNPTFQAAIGTGITLVQAPDRLPGGAANQGTISPNTTQTKQLSAFSQHTWRYQGRSSETITVVVEAASQNGSNRTGLYPYIGIYDSNGNILERSEPSGTDHSQSLTYLLPSNGTYTILIGGFGGTFGRYDIEVQSNSRQ